MFKISHKDITLNSRLIIDFIKVTGKHWFDNADEGYKEPSAH